MASLSVWKCSRCLFYAVSLNSCPKCRYSMVFLAQVRHDAANFQAVRGSRKGILKDSLYTPATPLLETMSTLSISTRNQVSLRIRERPVKRRGPAAGGLGKVWRLYSIDMKWWFTHFVDKWRPAIRNTWPRSRPWADQAFGICRPWLIVLQFLVAIMIIYTCIMV